MNGLRNLMSAALLSAGAASALPAQGRDSAAVGFIAGFLPGHARVRRDTFDDANWGGGDYYVKGIAKARGQDCAVDLYTRGDGADYRVRIDFRDSLLLDQQHAPESITLQAPTNRPAVQSWHMQWKDSKPKLLDDLPTTLPLLLLAVSNRDAGDRLVEASRRALALCAGR
jgi:hypothetical protein